MLAAHLLEIPMWKGIYFLCLGNIVTDSFYSFTDQEGTALDI